LDNSTGGASVPDPKLGSVTELIPTASDDRESSMALPAGISAIARKRPALAAIKSQG
jgi:hypothetical protein